VSEGFLSRIQGWFDAEYHGRYLGVILAEIGTLHPRVIDALLAAGLQRKTGKVFKTQRIEAEWTFGTDTGDRRADLAIFDSLDESADPVVLVEIKYHDKPIPAQGVRPAQFTDYQVWRSKGRDRAVLVLSREALFHQGLSAMTWTEAARTLRPFRQQSDFVEALVNHLEFEGLAMQDINAKSLIGFLQRILCSGKGVGQIAGNIEGPVQFGHMLNNMRLLSMRFNFEFKEAWQSTKIGDEGSGTKNAVVDFEISNRLEARDEAKIFLDDPSGNWIKQGVKQGGFVDIFARHSLESGSNWLRVQYGIRFEVEPKKLSDDEMPEVTLYAGAWGAKLDPDGVHAKSSDHKFSTVTESAEESSERLEKMVAVKLNGLFKSIKGRANSLTDRQRKAVIELETRMKKRMDR
jgi:hypothetical protein